MKVKYLALLLLPFGLMACQSSDIQKAGDLAVSILQQQNADQSLSAYQWQLTTAGAEQPLILNFNQDGRVAISTSCNNMMGSWKVQNNVLTISSLAATQKSCEEKAMQQENFASKLLNQAQLPFVLNLTDREAPTLSLVATTGEKVVFTGKMTPETKYQSQGETIFLEVAPDTKPCTGVGAQTCMQVREIKYNEQGLKTYTDPNWTLFYNQIEGFQLNPNLRQIIRVKRYTLKNPAADQSKYAYVYDMTVQSETVKQ
ncbi:MULTISPECIES: META and DUF4377 domain-containing protein [unclassified Acinetobacter]|uniref:META and DUF4377 domain-containing protein n=1 Tax=unclassified Acinetobacter TaxID=196816 RepID=UPI0029346052|nr:MULTISPECIES: META and DUF4377 domain-containing protein [unclassified Acinetobacter]WOE31586.1 META and DUF4377 domain-containing protein [Acinetobacter sp. SAAs470]WOE39783.1 META and DUF4377 domain-containing protein [Acinetobacter sp. SAAs474]